MRPFAYINKNQSVVFAFQWNGDEESLKNWQSFIPYGGLIVAEPSDNYDTFNEPYTFTFVIHKPPTYQLYVDDEWRQDIQLTDWVLKDDEYVWTISDDEFKTQYTIC